MRMRSKSAGTSAAAPYAWCSMLQSTSCNELMYWRLTLELSCAAPQPGRSRRWARAHRRGAPWNGVGLNDLLCAGHPGQALPADKPTAIGRPCEARPGRARERRWLARPEPASAAAGARCLWGGGWGGAKGLWGVGQPGRKGWGASAQRAAAKGLAVAECDGSRKLERAQPLRMQLQANAMCA